MDNKKKNMIIGIAIAAILVIIGGIVCLRVFRGFDAKKYVSAVLEQNMEGKVKTVTSVTKNLSEKEAKKQYEDLVSGFVTDMLARGLTLNEEQKEQCVKVAKKIFAGMKYEVQKSEKIGNDQYRVTVKYKKSDAVKKLQALAEQENININAKVENGEYRGTAEEITQQMQAEFAANLPKMMEEAYKTMEFGKAETMELIVKKGDNGLYKFDASEFIIKIMDLGEKQD